MTDRDKVIRGLECCMSEHICRGCPYREKEECEDGGYYYSKAIEDALALLREQEPVEPDGDNCGECGYTLHRINYDGPDKELRHEWFRFCPSCGKAVKWDA